MRKSLWTVLAVIALVLSACGPAMQPTAGPQTEGGETFLFALPRIVVDVDANGGLSTMGMKLSDVGQFFGQDFTSYRIDKFYVDWMTAANVQHVELRQTGDGLAILANGIPLPHLAWTDASLQQAADAAALFNVQGTDVIKKLLPAIRRLGLDVVLKFPLRADAKPIPLADPSVALAPAAPEKAEPSVVAKFEIKYDGNGVPAVLGISAQELQALGLNLPVALNQDAVRALQARNVQHMELRTKPDGLYLYINGNMLPSLVWDQKLLTSAADFYAQTNPTSPYINLVKQIAPEVDNADIGILAHFPLAPGTQPIPAKMH